MRELATRTRNSHSQFTIRVRSSQLAFAIAIRIGCVVFRSKVFHRLLVVVETQELTTAKRKWAGTIEYVRVVVQRYVKRDS